MSDDANIYSRLCRAVRTLAHLLSALKKWACMAELGHIFIGNRSATLFHRSAATACFAKECQMIRCSYLERNHCNPADSALSTVASSVGSAARSIVHFARQPSLCLFHLWINKETKRDDSLIWFVTCIFWHLCAHAGVNTFVLFIFEFVSYFVLDATLVSARNFRNHNIEDLSHC